jgi:hypothetical protein
MSDKFRKKIYQIFDIFIPTDKKYNLSLLYDNDIDIINIIKLFFNDYIVFLTSKFFTRSLFSLKRDLLSYYDKYEIVYLKYSDKNKIINIIQLFNIFIKKSPKEVKDIFYKEVIQEDKLRFLVLKKMKELHFYENSIEPGVFYKKILLSNQELFIPFNNYVLKKMEFKLRTFCQISEKLGAEKIVIQYNQGSNSKYNIDVSLNMLQNMIGSSVSNVRENNNSIEIIFEYPSKNHVDINLNKFYIIHSILMESEFLIAKEEYESDLELQFLIDTRCINFIHKYHTNFIINQMTNLENKIFAKSSSYGLNLEYNNYSKEDIRISVSVEFMSLHNKFDMIDGTNIYTLREGFVYLANIVRQEGSYYKLVEFLKSHLVAIENGWISLPYKYNYINDISKIYYHIVQLNMDKEEMEKIMKNYFCKNMSWEEFIKFRDLLLKGSDANNEKIYFITFQYHDILMYKNYLLKNISKIIDSEYNLFLNKNEENVFSIDDIMIDMNNLDTTNNNYNTVERIFYKDNFEYFQKNADKIKHLIFNFFKKSFYIRHGLSENIDNFVLMKNTINDIIDYYFINDIKNLKNDIETYILDDKSVENIDIKGIISEIINNICFSIINNNDIYILNSSPKINVKLEKRRTLYRREQKIFIYFLFKYFNYNEQSIKKYYKDIREKIESIISIDKCYRNYSKYKLFYTWDDFLVLHKLINLT